MPQLAVSCRKRAAQLLVDLAPLAVGRFERQRADDVAQRGAGQVDDLVLVVGDVVLGGLDVVLVGLDLEVHLGVHPGVEVVVGDDHLGLSLDQHLPDVHLEHPLDDGMMRWKPGSA